MINIDKYVAELDIRRELFAPANAQTLFTLTAAPVTIQTVGFYVNGIKYEATTHFTLAGVGVTWLDVPFVMATSDSVEITYVVRS